MAIPIITGLARAAYETRVPKRLYTAYEKLDDTLDAIDETKANYAIAQQRAAATSSIQDLARAQNLQTRYAKLLQRKQDLEAKIKSYRGSGRIPWYRQNPSTGWYRQQIRKLNNLRQKAFRDQRGADVIYIDAETKRTYNNAVHDPNISDDELHTLLSLIKSEHVRPGFIGFNNPLTRGEMWNLASDINETYEGFEEATGTTVHAVLEPDSDIIHLKIGRREIGIDTTGHVVDAGTDFSGGYKTTWQPILWSIIALIGLSYANSRRA